MKEIALSTDAVLISCIGVSLVVKVCQNAQSQFFYERGCPIFETFKTRKTNDKRKKTDKGKINDTGKKMGKEKINDTGKKMGKEKINDTEKKMGKEKINDTGKKTGKGKINDTEKKMGKEKRIGTVRTNRNPSTSSVFPSLPRRRGSREIGFIFPVWIPACAGMTMFCQTCTHRDCM